MDDNINNFMVDNRIRFLENRDNNSRWCDPDVSENSTIFFVKLMREREREKNQLTLRICYYIDIHILIQQRKI